MTGRLRQLWKNSPLGSGSFVANLLTISAGTVMAQIIAFAAIPLLTRIYSPSAFGFFATFLVLSNILSHASCLGYQHAIVLPRHDGAALSLWTGCLAISAGVGMIVGIVVLIFGDAIANLAGSPELAVWLWVLPVLTPVLAGTQATINWCIRKRHFGIVSLTVVANKLAAVTGQIGFGSIGGFFIGTGVLLGQFLGWFASLALVLLLGLPGIPRKAWKQVTPGRIWRLLLIYRQFPGYGLLSSILASVGRSMPVLCLGYFYSSSIVGFFALANQLATGPIQIVTSAIFSVFYERANRAKTDGNLAEVTSKLYKKLAAVFFTPACLIFLAAPYLTVVFLGHEWEQTGLFLRWMSIWIYFLSSVAPLQRIFHVLSRQRELAIANFSSSAVGAGALVAGGLLGSATLAVALFSACVSLVYLLQVMRILTVSGCSPRIIVKVHVQEILKALPFVALMGFMLQTENELLISGMTIILFAVFALIRLRHITKND
jgi:O-antigen/teichoic acid export membrane protein